MKSSLQQIASQASLLSLLLLQGLPSADGHYGFPVFMVNGIASDWWEYIRPTDLDAYGGQFFPDYSWYGEAQVCGWNGTNTGYKTKTAKINAGDVVGFQAYASNYLQGYQTPHPFGQGDGIGHYGPGQAYMSKAPGKLEDYKGDGDWFKIGLSGSSDGQHWDSDRAPELNFTIPQTTPPGKYLVRVEHFNISPDYNGTQMYVNCAQVDVSGPGGGTPGPTIKFPGGYDPTDKNIWIPRAMYMPYKPTDLLKNYKGPGPSVWTG